MHCMRCGRETANGEAFCPDCLKAKKDTPKTAETAERRSILWVEQKLHAGKSADEQTEKRSDPAVLLRIGLIASVTLLLAVTVGTAVEHFRYRDIETLKRDLSVREASITLREKDANRLDSRVSELEQQLADAEAELQTQKSAVGKLEKTERELSALEREYTEQTEQIGFWNKTVVFYSVGNDWYYHHYGCEKLDLTKPFQVYTPKTAAETAKLVPCPVCCGNG